MAIDGPSPVAKLVPHGPDGANKNVAISFADQSSPYTVNFCIINRGDKNILTTEISNILENMGVGINLARQVGRPIYIFKIDGDWGYCGKLPAGAECFYIAYPHGSLDQSQNAPEISLNDWSEYGDKFIAPMDFSKPKKESWFISFVKSYFPSFACLPEEK